MLFADSLINGFLSSNLMGKGIVLVQLLSSVIMVAVIIGKAQSLGLLSRATRKFLREFGLGCDVLDYYLSHRTMKANGPERIYKETCERLLKLLSPETRSLLMGHNANDVGAAALTSREIELVKGTAEHILDEEEIRAENGMGVIATVVALSPMLGLLGTVWGVLDAFAEMGSAGSANLATIAPSISAALVTTVVGLLIAIPGVVAFNRMNAIIRDIASEMEGFTDEIIGRIACEFQGRGL